MSPRAREPKAKSNNQDYIKLESFSTGKKIVYDGNVMGWVKMLLVTDMLVRST